MDFGARYVHAILQLDWMIYMEPIVSFLSTELSCEV